MNKAIIMLIGIAMGTSAASAQDKKVQIAAQQASAKTQTSQAGKLVFVKDTYDFGELTEGDPAAYDFVFTNKGKVPVLIKSASAGCGCTKPTAPTAPILSGKTDKIHVAYTTAGHPGPFTKEVIVLSDAEEGQMVLHIKGTVKPKPTGIAASVPAAGSSTVVNK